MSAETPNSVPLEANPAPGFVNHPEHAIDLKAFEGTVTVSWHETTIARSDRALELHETNHPPVFYLPIEDVDAALLRRSTFATKCPFKGEASYWNIALDDHEIDNAMWGYETPYDEMLELAGLVAFYPSKVTIETSPG